MRKVRSSAWALLLGAAACSLAPVVCADEARADAPRAGTAADRAADLDQLWDEVEGNYVYLGDRAAAWRAARPRYASLAAQADTLDAWTSVLARALDELADFHIEVNPRPSDDWRPVPTCAMAWAEWRGDQALVTAVQPGSRAAQAGVLPGDEILALDGQPIATAVPPAATPALRGHRLLQRLAGRRRTHIDLSLRAPGGATRTVRLECDCEVERAQEPVSARRLPSGHGLIRFNNSLGDTATVAAFDAALASLHDVPALIVDLRDTPSGGNSTVALGVLGRFIDHRAPYQMHRIPAYGLPDVERTWLEEASPRGPFQYTGRVVVLADHWTGSMGEGMASGFDALGRATVVGTSLGRLNGSIQGIELAHTHVAVKIPEEQIFHVGGTPRHEWNPPVLVDLVAARGQEDAELAKAEEILSR